MNRRDFLLNGAAAFAAGTVKRSMFAKAEEVTQLSAFAHNFRFGAATSSVQIEGSAHEDGKGASMWDCFATRPDTIATA